MDQYDRWAEETAHEFSPEEIIPWLETQSFDTWHQFVLGWNWDNGIDELYWIISQPECDMGTSCYVFFLAGNSFSQFETLDEVKYDYQKQYWQMYNDIVARWNADSYTNKFLYPHGEKAPFCSDYAGGMSYYFGFTQGLTSAGKSLPWSIPQQVLNYQGERAVDSKYQFESLCRFERFDLWKARQA